MACVALVLGGVALLPATHAFTSVRLAHHPTPRSVAQSAHASRPANKASLPVSAHPLRRSAERVRGLAVRAGASDVQGDDDKKAKAEAAAALVKAKENEKYVLFGWFDLRLVVLLALVAQNACQMLSMRYSRVAAAATMTPYLASTAVVVSELLKVAVCLVILFFQNKGATPKLLWQDIVVNWRDTVMVSVPAFVYMMQNNLLYVATSNLDAATCQITYQLKILTTALFAVGMLGKRISPTKWLSLFILVAGVILVQLPQMGAGAAVVAGNPAVGLAAVVTACFMSGFAGIYFEKVLKGTPTSIWVRNVQMGSIGAVLAILAAYIKDGAAIASAGFFQGWSPLVASVACQVGVGGLIVALVVRFADNILKGFATSLSIIASGLISMYLLPALQFTPTLTWVMGSGLVVVATVMYSLPDKPSK